MSDGKPNDDPLQVVRRAPSYPAFLRVARLYASGLALLMIPVLVVACSGLDVWFLLPSAAGFALLVVAFVLAAKGYQQLEHDLPDEKITGVRSAATIAAFQDLVRRR
ncbi:hypothetical protein [Actinoplanes sp. NPDC049118]|uniref:hypothetical protein n=1 Tax=Actinoplanes sp. NPDC049118 TaxID=3155769 RepID=UPI0033D74A96